MRTSISVAAAMMLLAPALVMPRAHPSPSAQEARPTVVLPQSVGPAGGSVSVPVQLTTEGAKIGELKLSIRFAAAKLRFIKVQVGGAAIAADATATGEASRDGDDTVVKVTIATPAAAQREPLPDGPIAQMLLVVAKDLKPETKIPLKLEASAVDTTAAAGAIATTARDGEVIVSNGVAIGCFFYMH